MTDLTNSLRVITPDALIQAGEKANEYASANIFADYQQRVAANTLRRQAADLALFECYLGEAGVSVSELAQQPVPWRGITWGIVAGFVRWMLNQGYAVGSVNVRLATVKRYAELAYQAGALTTEAFALIRTVKGYGRSQQKKVDEKRGQSRQDNTKKAAAIIVPPKLARALKTQPDTPQGRRDAVLMCLLLEHGLRCSEVTGLTVGAIDLNAETLTFYRPKVDMITTHTLTRDTRRALQAYLPQDASPLKDDPLLRGSNKGGTLTAIVHTDGKVMGGMSERAINGRVRDLARKLETAEIAQLSPHDCRHTAATYYARTSVPLDRLQSWGGWNSLAMPLHYIERTTIANEGMEEIDLYAD